MHIPQLDGIRFVAILMVIANHMFNASWGWMGVDLFFVLSGYLITTILRRSRDDEHFWKPFYLKRATRILPAFLLCIALCALVLRGSGLGLQWLPYVFFVADFAQASNPEAGGPLAPLWSLAVEEHFYFLWPIAVRYLSRKRLIALVVGTLALEPVLRAFATLHGASSKMIYFATPFRLDALAAGSLLALLVENESAKQWIARRSGALCLLSVAVFGGCHFVTHAFRRPANSVSFNAFGYSLIALICASAISYVLLNGRSLAARLLCLQPFVFLGVISYGLYLFNLVIFEATKRAGLHGEAAPLTALAVTVLFSWLSFRYFERPITHWGRRLAAKSEELPSALLEPISA